MRQTPRDPVDSAWESLVVAYSSYLENELFVLRTVIELNPPEERPSSTYSPLDMWTAVQTDVPTLSPPYSLFNLPPQAMDRARKVCEFVLEWYPRLRMVEPTVVVPYGFLVALEPHRTPEVPTVKPLEISPLGFLIAREPQVPCLKPDVPAVRPLEVAPIKGAPTEVPPIKGAPTEVAHIDSDEFVEIELETIPYADPFPSQPPQDIVDTVLEKIRSSHRPTFVKAAGRYATLEELGSHNVQAKEWEFSLSNTERDALNTFLSEKIVGEYFENAEVVVGRYGLKLWVYQIEGHPLEEKNKRPWPEYVKVILRDPEDRRPHTRRAVVTKVVGVCA